MDSKTKSRLLAASATTAVAAVLLTYTTPQPLTSTIHVSPGTDFEINIGAKNYASEYDINPDSTVASYNPSIENTGDFPAYVFIELASSDKDLVPYELNASEWSQLTGVGDRTIYAYATSSGMTALDKEDETPELCQGLTLADDTDLWDNANTLTVEAIGYAIQTTDLGTSKPEDVWKKLNNPTQSDDSASASQELEAVEEEG